MSEWQPEIVTLKTDHFTFVRAGDKVRIGKRGELSSLPDIHRWGALVPLYSEAFGSDPVAYVYEASFADYFVENVTYVG